MVISTSSIANYQAARLQPNLRPRARSVLAIGFVSTFPPTKCGLATFTASLAGALSDEVRIGVVSCVDESGETLGAPEVIGEWVRGSAASLTAAVEALDDYDAVIVQHEFGVFGGPDGDDVLELLARLRPPAVAVLHTVLERPSPNQRRIIEELAGLVERIVVQSAVARDRLLAAHDVEPEQVEVIQHGAPANILPGQSRRAAGRRPTVLTWGLLGPGKGIEFAIEALAELRDLNPLPRYLVLGETHPNIVRRSGDAYRESLQALAVARGVDDIVEFDARYRRTAEVLAEIRNADVVLLPYLSRDQVVSGVLVEAIASGRPVVSTAFPHAVELLAEGSGIVVPHEDRCRDRGGTPRPPDGRDRRRSCRSRRSPAGALAHLGDRCPPIPTGDGGGSPREDGGRRLSLPDPPLAHLAALTDTVGVFEHARFAAPRVEHGYCTDDVARALGVATRELGTGAGPARLAGVYLGFLERAQRPDGRFRNRRTAGLDRGWTDSQGSDDSQGRALFGLGIAAAQGAGELARRALACFERGAPAFESPSPRANAYALLGAAEVALRHPGHAAAEDLFVRTHPRLGRPSLEPGWPWPEQRLAYDNARLAEARIAAGVAFARPELLDEGLRLLEWLVAIERAGDHFSFAPSGGFGPGDPRPGFDQQPIEAGAMADACARAFLATGERRFAGLAELAANWFLGVNDTGVELYDPTTGGCCDGLERAGRNENQGAESTLALISALQSVRETYAAARSARSSSSVSTYAAPTLRSAAPYVM